MKSMTMADVKEMVKEVVDEAVAPLKEKQTNWMGELAKGISTLKEPEPEPGIISSQIIMGLAASKMNLDGARKYAEKHWYKNDTAGMERFDKALAAGVGEDGAFLLREAVDDGIIELLRPASVVRSLNPLTVGLEGGQLRMPKLTNGSAGGWIGENANAPATQPRFGSVQLQAKKYASLVPISNDLIRRAPMNAAQVVRDDMVADIGQATDLAYMLGSGNAGEPKGLFELAASANLLTAQTSPTTAKVIQDLGTMIQTLMDNDVRMLRPGWIIEPRTWKALFTMLDGNSNPVFRTELNQGTIFGFPFRISSQIPRTDDPGGAGTKVFLADFADVILGEATSIMVDVSDSAAYHDGSAVQASYSLDQSVLRALVETDMNTRHPESIVVLQETTWDSVTA